MKSRVLCVMEIGPRADQDDCILAGDDVFQEKKFRQTADIAANTLLLAVCDGMGGHAGGEAASRFVCSQFRKDFDPKTDFSPEAIRKILSRIQTLSVEYLAGESGSTIAGIAVQGNQTIAFNAGDSRVYKLTPTEITCISHDHSLVQHLVDRSFITEKEAFDHPHRNIINYGIGPAFANISKNQKVHFHVEALLKNTWYLICSDGVNDLLRDGEIHELLMPNPVENGTVLLDALKDRRLKDNVSFVIADIQS